MVARATVTFDGVLSMIYKGDVGVSPATFVAGSYPFDNGQGQIHFVLSSDFADSVQAAHTAAMEVRVNGQDMEMEIGGKAFIPGTYHPLCPWTTDY
jgi:hypothetical protein